MKNRCICISVSKKNEDMVDLLDEYAEREGYVDWELVPLTDESPYWGDTLVRFIKE